MFKVYVQVRYYTFTTSHLDILSTTIHTSISVSLHIHDDQARLILFQSKVPMPS
jgi:hypothetical protein